MKTIDSIKNEIAALPDEIVEAATKAILFEDCGNAEDWRDNVNLGQAAIRAVLQSEQVKMWRQDSIRYWWLAMQEAQIQSKTLHGTDKIVYRVGWPDDGDYQIYWYPTISEAIDAAMEQNP